MKKMRAGIIGVGFIGAVHVEQLRRLGNVEVVAITDFPNAQGKADALCVPKGYEDYKEMIDKENLDCVHICTPNNTHYEMAMYAMNKGVHVVCEKPMTTTLQEAQELEATLRKNKLVGAINLNCRFYPMAYQIREMIKSGELGEIYTISGGYLQDWLFLDTDYNWRLEPELSGISRAFSDIGSHWIDLVEFVSGLKAEKVLADFATFHKTRKKPTKPIETFSNMSLRPEDFETVAINTEDYCNVLFKMEGETRACCNISQVCAGRKNQISLSIAGSKCSVHWNSENSNELWIGRRDRDNGLLAKDPSILNDATRKVISYPGGHVEGFPDTFKQNFKSIYSAIANNQTTGGDFANFEDGVREMLLCEKVVQSAAEERWITI